MVVYKTMLNDERVPSLVKESEMECNLHSIAKPQHVDEIMREAFSLERQTEEYVYELCLDTKNNLIGVFEISHGTVNTSIASPREVFQKALLVGAKGIVIVHNHPSGDCSPSNQDIKNAKKIKEAGNVMDINLLDFIIIGSGYLSFREEGIIKEER